MELEIDFYFTNFLFNKIIIIMYSWRIIMIDVTIAIVIVLILIAILFLFGLSWNFSNKETCTLDEYCSSAQTGDIILFSSSTPDLRWSIGNGWSHIGIVIKDDSNPSEPFFVESDIPLSLEEVNRIDLLTGEKVQSGVKMTSLRTKLNHYKGELAFRKLIGPTYLQEKINGKEWIDMIKKLSFVRYENSANFWLQRFFAIRKLLPTSMNLKNFQGRKKAFCSELATHILKHQKIIKRHINPASVLPHHFSSYYTSLNSNFFKRGWSYGTQIRIIK